MNTHPLTADERIEVIRSYKRAYELKHNRLLRFFVETGTCDGYTTMALKNDFDLLATIELDPDFYQRAVKKFQKERHVFCMFGDSAWVLPKIINQLDDHPALFWLDAHYDGRKTRGEKDTPVMEELEAIFSRKNVADVILIDDARFFGTDPAYPTLNQVNDFISPLTLELKDDIIRILR